MKLIVVIAVLFQQNCIFQCFSNGEEHTKLPSEYKKKSFFFLPPIIPLNSFKRKKQSIPTKDHCIGDCGLNGFCTTKSDCISNNGTASGLCSDSTVCCINYLHCSSTSNAEISYFVNPNYPNAYNGGSQCSVTITKLNPKICQLRLEFKEFSLIQPTNESSCINDFFSVNNGFKNKLCGENKGQHIYLNFNDAKDKLLLSMDTNSAEQIARMWNIEIKQIYCNSSILAPSGCLMYFTSTSGTVSSFNFGSLNPEENKSNRMIAGLKYGICVKSNDDYCAIEWSQDKDPYAFSISGNATLISTTNVSMAINGSACDNNFIVIANPYQKTVTPLNVDRFCGSSFNPITTLTKPFVLYSVTGQNSSKNILNEGNRGFKLNFRQLPCNT